MPQSEGEKNDYFYKLGWDNAIGRAVEIVEKFYLCRYWENPQHDVIEEIVQLIKKEKK